MEDEDQMENEQGYSPEELAFMEEELMDADIAGTMGRLYLSHPKMASAIGPSTKNPETAAVLVAQTLLETRNKLMSKGYPFSQRIWTAENGVLPEMVDSYAHMAKMQGKDLSDDFKAKTKEATKKLLVKYDKAGMPKGEEYPHDAEAPQADPMAGSALGG